MNVFIALIVTVGLLIGSYFLIAGIVDRIESSNDPLQVFQETE